MDGGSGGPAAQIDQAHYKKSDVIYVHITPHLWVFLQANPSTCPPRNELCVTHSGGISGAVARSWWDKELPTSSGWRRGQARAPPACTGGLAPPSPWHGAKTGEIPMDQPPTLLLRSGEAA